MRVHIFQKDVHCGSPDLPDWMYLLRAETCYKVFILWLVIGGLAAAVVDNWYEEQV